MKQPKIAYIGGGSRKWGRTFMNDMAKAEGMDADVYLYDIDKEAAEANQKIGGMYSALPEAKSKLTYTVATSLEHALKDADFVIISILPGSFDDMESDVHTPEKYGVFQSVGDTAGAGGIIRAVRTLPIFFDLAKEVEKHCPKAWVLNFTNPMTMCVRALYYGFPDIKAYGVCHEVAKIPKLLAKYAKLNKGLDINEHDIFINVFGVNHFTWVDKATCGNIDLIPIWQELVSKYDVEGYHTSANSYEKSNYFTSLNKVKMDLYKKYGSIAAAGDRHLAEFVPNAWYMKNAEEWGFLLTPVSYRKTDLIAERQKTKDLIDGTKKVSFIDSGESFTEQIAALMGKKPILTNINLPNRGQMANFANNAIVETNAYITYNNVSPIIISNIAAPLESKLISQSSNQEAVVKAIFEKDKKDLFAAFANESMLQVLDLVTCEKLFNEMLANTSKAFEKYWVIK